MNKAFPVNSLRAGTGGSDTLEIEGAPRRRHRKMSVASEQVSSILANGNPPVPPKHDSKSKIQVTVQHNTIDLERLEKENASLHHELNKSKIEFARALEEVNKSLAEAGRARQKQLQAETALQRAHSHGSGHQSLRNENARLHDALRDAYDQIRGLENKIRMGGSQLRRTEEESRQNLEALYAENELLQEKVRENDAYMHEILQSTMKDGRWNPPPDDLIRDRLKRVHDDTRDWAKKWTHDNFSISHLKPELAADVRRLFSKFVRCEADGSLPAAIESPSPKMKSKIPPLLLTAALAHRLEVEFFKNSFFCLDTEEAKAMRNVYDCLENANTQEANIWRSTTWRILNPPQTSNMTDIDKTVVIETSQRVRKLCDRIVADFMLSPASVLLRPVKEGEVHDRSRSLQDVLLSAADVATSLWTQRSFMSCINMPDFVENRTSFKVTSPLMDPHPMNRIDRDDAAHNGREILIVTRPCILAFEESDRKRLRGDNFRVLAKAIVLLEEPKKGGVSRG